MTLLPEATVLWAWLLAAARLGGLAMVAPALGERAVPRRLRAFIAVALALAIPARGLGGATVPDGLLPAVGMLALEAALGVAMGYGVRLLLVGLQLAAVHVAQQSGLGLAESYNPLGAETPISLRRFYQLLGLVVFLGIGGHRWMLEGVYGSFQALPPGAAGLPGPAVASLAAALLGLSFSVALKVAAPVLVALLVVSAAVGILQRTAPQFHVLSVTMPVRTVVGLLVAATSLTILAPLLSAAGTALIDAMTRALDSGATP